MRFGSEAVRLPNFIKSLFLRYSVQQTFFPIVFPEQSHIHRKNGCLKGCFPSMLTQSIHGLKEQTCKQWSILVHARHGNNDIQSKII